MNFSAPSDRLIGRRRRALAGSTALAALVLGAVALSGSPIPGVSGPALAAPGAGGAGAGTGGAGGAGGASPGGTGTNGAAGTGGGTGGRAGGNGSPAAPAGEAGSGGGGGGGGRGGATGAASVTAATGTAGGAGGAGSGASAANAGGGGGGGAGGAGVISATGGTLAGAATGGAGGAGGAAGPGATAGSGGDGGAGVVITGNGQTLTNNGQILGGTGGAAGGAGAAAGLLGAGVVGNGTLTLINNGVIDGALVGVDDLVNNGTLLRGNGFTVGSLSGSNAGAAIRSGGELNVNGNGSSTTYAGGIFNGAGTTTALTKTGAGDLVLTGVSTYTGPTTVSDGVLRIGAGGSLTGSPVTNAANFLVDAGAAVTAPTIVNNGFMQIDAAVTATASFTNNLVLAANAPITTPSFTNTGEVGGTLVLNGLATGSNAAGGFIPDGLSIASPGTASFANAGSIGTGGLALQNRGGTLQFTNSGNLYGHATSAAGSATTIASSGSWLHAGDSLFSGPATITNSGFFQSAAAGTISGLATFDNTATGKLFVSAPLGGSIGTFTNAGQAAAGGGVFLEGRSLPVVGTFNNNGYLRVTAFAGGRADVTLAAASFNNGSAGRIDLTGNGLATDRLTIAGNFTGAAGSRVAVDVSLAPSGPSADVLQITGSNNGRTTLEVNRVDDPRAAGYSSRPVPVVVAGSGSGEVVLATPLRGTGMSTFELQSSGPGSYQLVSRLETPAAAGAPTLFRSLLTSLNVGFFDSVGSLFGLSGSGAPDDRFSSSVSSGNMSWAQLTSRPSPYQPDGVALDVTPDTTAVGVWANGGGGEFVLRGTDTASYADGSRASRSRVDLDYAGIQVGIDMGWFNIDNSGWTVRAGLTSGTVGGNATQKIGSQTTASYDVPFVGLYLAATDGRFFGDVSYRHDFVQSRVTNSLAGMSGQHVDFGADTVSGTAGYRFSLADLHGGDGDVFVEPSGTLIYSRIDGIAIPVTGGSVQAGNVDSLLGRLGIRIGTTLRPNGGLVLQPFVSASVWNEFAGSTRTRFVSANIAADPNAFVPILSDRVGTFGQAGGGLSAQVLGTSICGFVKAEARIGDRLEGYAVNGGARYQF